MWSGFPSIGARPCMPSSASTWGRCSATWPSNASVTVEEGHLQVDHVHMLISIPPKYAVAQVIGYVKGKSAIHIARTYLGRRQNFTGQSFWARGYYVSTVGRDEATIREYIQKARGGGPAPRPTQYVRAVAPPSGGGRFANRFERFTSFKPPALPVVI